MDDEATTVEDVINELCMEGRIGAGELLPNSWIVIVDIGDEVRVFADRHSKGYTTMGLCDYAKEMVLASEFDEGRGLI